MPPRPTFTDADLEEFVHAYLSSLALRSSKRYATVTIAHLSKLLFANRTRIILALDGLCRSQVISVVKNKVPSTAGRFFPDGQRTSIFVVLRFSPKSYLLKQLSITQNSIKLVMASGLSTISQPKNQQNDPQNSIKLVMASGLTPATQNRPLCIRNTSTTSTRYPGASGIPLMDKNKGEKISRRRKKRPPNRLSEREQFEYRAMKIEMFRVLQLSETIKKLHREIFHFDFWGISQKRSSDWTCAQRIVQLCLDNDWNSEDFLRVQFNWFKLIGRKPTISNLCGDKARARYDDWLRSEGYAAGDSVDVKRRNHDLALGHAQKQNVATVALHGLLYSQMLEQLDRYLERYRASLADTPLQMNLPSWLELSEERKRQWAIDCAVAKEKHRIVLKWWSREHERQRLKKLVLIEMETGKKSVAINGTDLRRYGLPEWLVEEHEAICMRGN
jgi:hypothetical protein